MLWDENRTKQNPAHDLRGVNDAIDRNESATCGNAAMIKCNGVDKVRYAYLRDLRPGVFGAPNAM
jgi:hypothetical protein